MTPELISPVFLVFLLLWTCKCLLETAKNLISYEVSKRSQKSFLLHAPITTPMELEEFSFKKNIWNSFVVPNIKERPFDWVSLYYEITAFFRLL